jgi:hypothetical protein
VTWPISSAGQRQFCVFHPGRIKDIFLYRNYDHVASLWKLEQWIPQSTVDQARAHYAAYSVQRTDGLRIISLNTDLCKCCRVSRVNLGLHSVYASGYRYGSV